MPVEVRECIARAVTKHGKCTDEAINYAQTSELQRRAVLATISKNQEFELEARSLSDEWTTLLAGH